MGKTRDLFRKIGDIKGTFHARTGMIKDRKNKDLTEEKRSRIGGKNRQKNYARTILMTLIITIVWLSTLI